MHLKSLDLTAFKSFAEAKIEFPQGVTAVVGPNGTGKSNLVDAILWVLGEQSTKTLRSERMEDVIFNGTESRKPLGMAEVSMVISNVPEQHLQGLGGLSEPLNAYNEVMITRRLYRNGDSEYLINKTLCRLKDLRSLFLDTRAGAKGHTIIEQGRLEHILNASPQDRRELIEETAGIVRYKKQKAEALRKLESTQQNLLRVRDIIAELRRQLNSLDRQARQARAYQTLLQEARRLEIRLLARDCRALLAGQSLVEAELATLETKEASLTADQARLAAQLEELRLRLTAGDTSIGRIREELSRVDYQQGQAVTAVEVERGRLGLYEQQRAQAVEDVANLGRARERAAAELAGLRERLANAQAETEERGRGLAELEEVAGTMTSRRAVAAEAVEHTRRGILDITVQVTSGGNSLAGLESRLEEVRRRAARLAEEQVELEGQRAQEHARVGDATRSRDESERQLRSLQQAREAAVLATQRLEDAVGQTVQALGRQQEELAAVESRMAALQGVLREEMGYGREGQGESTSLRAACAGVREAVAEWLVVPPGLERAIEAALGERVRAWLVAGPVHAQEAIAFLKHRGLGRGAFLPQRPRWSAEAAGRRAEGWWPALREEPGVLGRAFDLVQVQGESQEALACLFDDAVIVDSLSLAIELWERGLWAAPDGPTLVTRDGEVVDPAGVITGGAAGATGGLLQRRREIQDLQAQLTTRRQAVEDHRRLRERLSAESESAKATMQRLDEAIREADLQLLAMGKDQAAFSQNVMSLDRRLDTVRAERQMADEELVRIEAELATGRERLTQLAQEKLVREAGLVAAQDILAKLEEDSRGLLQRMTESRLAVAEFRPTREHCEADVTRLVAEDEDHRARAATLEKQIETLVEAVRLSQSERERNEALFQELDRRGTQLRAELVSLQEAQTQDAEAARQRERELATVREALVASREARTAVEVRRAEIKTQLAALENTLTGTYQLALAEALEADREAEAKEQAEAQEQGKAQVEAEGRQEEEREKIQEPGTSDELSVALREELRKIRERLDRVGAVNLAAIEEHRELDERYRFLTAQEEDLANSIRSLRQIITRINRTTKAMFLQTFEELQAKFGEVYGRFFPGGRAELILVEPQVGEEPKQGADPEPGVDIVAQPPGKRLKNIAMLSGGEKTLTAMALIFASFLIRPTPFCILDEIDAPLDEENIGRFTGVLKELAEGAQFIVITHNKTTMAVADSLFGVTMEEPGISKLVSVRLADLQPA